MISPEIYQQMKILVQEYELEPKNDNKSQQPYLLEFTINSEYKYNKNYGDDRICKCGHTYYRHFDPYENMESGGCKYCQCSHFEELKEEDRVDFSKITEDWFKTNFYNIFNLKEDEILNNFTIINRTDELFVDFLLNDERITFNILINGEIFIFVPEHMDKLKIKDDFQHVINQLIKNK